MRKLLLIGAIVFAGMSGALGAAAQGDESIEDGENKYWKVVNYNADDTATCEKGCSKLLTNCC